MAKPHVFEPLLAKGAAPRRLVNRTRGLVLAEHVEAAFDSRARKAGLLGRDALAHETVMAIAPCNAIHTFGMRFPIDVLFIRRDGTVLKRVLGLKRGRVSMSLRAFAVLEFGADHPVVHETRTGDRLSLEPRDSAAG